MTRRSHVVYGVVLALCLTSCGGGGDAAPTAPTTPTTPTTPTALGSTYRASGHAAAGDVFVHLFEWRWPDIARECELFLGPKGYKGVQISPPSEHAVITSGGAFYPWWQRYQTVSYKLDQSRSGTAAELRDMVTRCKSVGVEIYADVVINHMTAGSGVGSAGSRYSKYDYPAVPYRSSDFHNPCSIDSYQIAFQVQNCELVGLSDLRTEDASVQNAIAQYLIALNAIGVAGYRIDAAKHVPAKDLDAIVTLVNVAAAGAGRATPYVFMEIIAGSGEAVTPQQYYGVGYASGGAADITDFSYGSKLTDAFGNRNGGTLNAVSGQAPGVLLSDKSVVFVENHDTQRGSSLIYQNDGYEMAVMFMLSYPQGYPSVMSSYGFDRSTGSGRDAGPPSVSAGVTQSTFSGDGSSKCTASLGPVQIGSWICEHRRPAIANMVAFRRVAASAPVSTCGRTVGTIGDDPNRIALCRDGAGFVAFNRTTSEMTATLPTRLAPGSYCNVGRFQFTPAGGSSAATCSGAAIVVTANGDAALTVPAMTTLALHTGARLN